LVGVDLFEQTLATVGAQAPHVRHMRRAMHRTRDRQPVLGHDHVFTTTEPSRAVWKRAPVGGDLESIACPSASLCVAVGQGGALARSTNPTADNSQSATIDDGRWLNSIACPSVSLRVARDTTATSSPRPTPPAARPPGRQRLIDGHACTDTTPCSVEQIEASDGTGLHTLDSGQFPGTGPFLTGLKLTSDVLSWSHAGTPPTVTLTPDHRNRQPLAQRPGRWLTRLGAGWRLVA
jgi:hypothetical protein